MSGYNMERFHLIDDAATVLVKSGVFRQAKVYRRGVDIYAAYGVGFVRLYGGSGTSVPNLTCIALELPDNLTVGPDKFGRLQLVDPA